MNPAVGRGCPRSGGQPHARRWRALHPRPRGCPRLRQDSQADFRPSPRLADSASRVASTGNATQSLPNIAICRCAQSIGALVCRAIQSPWRLAPHLMLNSRYSHRAAAVVVVVARVADRPRLARGAVTIVDLTSALRTRATSCCASRLASVVSAGERCIARLAQPRSRSRAAGACGSFTSVCNGRTYTCSWKPRIATSSPVESRDSRSPLRVISTRRSPQRARAKAFATMLRVDVAARAVVAVYSASATTWRASLRRRRRIARFDTCSAIGGATAKIGMARREGGWSIHFRAPRRSMAGRSAPTRACDGRAKARRSWSTRHGPGYSRSAGSASAPSLRVPCPARNRRSLGAESRRVSAESRRASRCPRVGSRRWRGRARRR